MKKRIVLYVFILGLCIFSFIFPKDASAFTKDDTALVDLVNIYWKYNETEKQQKILVDLKREMINNITPLSNNLKRVKGLINSGSYSKEAKYDYMKEYFLLSSQVQMLVSEYNKQLMTIEQEVRENLLKNIWNAIKTYTKLKGYKYIFKIGQDDVIAYNPDLDISSRIIDFLNTVPNASELSMVGEALVLKNNARVKIGNRSISVSAGRKITVLHDPENVLSASSNGKKFSYNDNDYYVTVMYESEIGLISASYITTNMKTTKVDLKLGNSYTTYIGYENYLNSSKNNETGEYDFNVIKVPRLYIEKEGSSDSFKGFDINTRNLNYVEISEIKDINKDSIPDIFIYYISGENAFLKIVNAEVSGNGSYENVNINKISPYSDIKINTLSIPRSTSYKGFVMRTIESDNKYYTLDQDNNLVFTQVETDFYIKNNHDKERNPYKSIKPVKKIIKYNYDKSKNRYQLLETDGPMYIERSFSKSYSPVYKGIGDIDHIAEIRKNEIYYIESGTIPNRSYNSDEENDLWLKIILIKTFSNEEELKSAGFPANSQDGFYNFYQKSNDGSIYTRYYAYIHNSNININGLIKYLGLPFDIY